MLGRRESRLSATQRATLVAVATAALPAGTWLPAGGAQTVEKLEVMAASLSPRVIDGWRALLHVLDVESWMRHRKSFARVGDRDRLAILEALGRGGIARRTLLRGLTAPLKAAHFDNADIYKKLGCVYTFDKPQRESLPQWRQSRVHDGLDEDIAIQCDVVIVGTGAGGAVIGKELAESGVAVVFVEAGDFVDRASFNGRPLDMQAKMYNRSAATIAVGNTAIPIPIGRTVGGSTTINSGTCYRAPAHVFEHWSRDFGLRDFSADSMAPHYQRVEAILGVAPANAAFLGGNARVIARGCEAMGLSHHGPLRRNAPDCDGKGVCVFGCPTDAKRSMTVSYVPLALKAGAELFTGATMDRIVLEGGRASGIVARTATGRSITVSARAVVIAGGALITPALLARQQLGGASGQLGGNLSIHPAAGLLAEFDERIAGWDAIPQGYGIEDFAEQGILFEGATTPLETTMTVSPAIGPRLIQWAEAYDRVASFGFMVEDTSRGRVRGNVTTYWLGDGDVARLKRGVDILAQVFFAAGAKQVMSPVAGFEVLHSVDDLTAFRRSRIAARDIDLSAYHPLGTARMGHDARSSVVDETHQVHGVPGLYVVDGSAVPSSLGVNPQMTIMAMATRAAGLLVTKLSSY